MASCVKCGRALHPREAVFFAPAPIGGRAQKCQGCGKFTQAEVQYVAQFLGHQRAYAQAPTMGGGCRCQGRRR